MSTELIPYVDVRSMAEEMAASQMFGFKTPAQALTMMLIAQANGQHPAAAARDYDLIDGKKPSKKAEAMLRDFLAAGGSVQWHQLDNEIADATFSHPQGGSVRIDWSIQRARDASLAGKDVWKKYPRSMLRSRCISEGVRTVYPAATGGLPAPEEAMHVNGETGTADTGEVRMPQRKAPAPAADVVDVDARTVGEPVAAPPDPTPRAPMGGPGTINAGQVKYLQNKAKALELSDEAVAALLARHGAAGLDTSMTVAQFDAIKAELLSQQ